jgi:hypothetical protein
LQFPVQAEGCHLIGSIRKSHVASWLITLEIPGKIACGLAMGLAIDLSVWVFWFVTIAPSIDWCHWQIVD